ncbi:multidrug efflux pump subunit AcrA (membrane-fusion protein) [Paenibacillus taihuensis]|uniref:Multidrug efflux pump subunit AcrA (Membrane-fusion protein) n=1 Tax=Paenibacillus taihuensis TaxID=1156355 RepID=A0A3D9Q3D6_9BACL|nr:biotin/lipoyl-binding protein [Paenibacillus taihuensis]REE55424.1 multidrug efflux pump subunit AcrA (membrane-fusion protein) [Paenibacillus taihuensis]
MEERAIQSRKRRIRVVAGLFVVMLIAFTLAGNTLRSLSLPKVYTAAAEEGTVKHNFETTAILQPGETRALANPAGWKVSSLLVKEGDQVHRGQLLIQYDDSNAMQQLTDLNTDLKKLDLSMSLLQADYIAAVNGGDVTAKISAGNAIETAKLDIATKQQYIKNLKQSILENSRLTAPFDGIVTQVNAAEGLPSGGLPDLVLSNTSKGYQIRIQVPGATAALLEVGEVMDDITLEEDTKQQLQGTITAIDQGTVSGEPNLADSDVPSGNIGGSASSSSVTIIIKEAALRGGERVSVSITKMKGEPTITVPNKAVHQDEKGAYVYTLREESGPLGNAYYAVETPIHIVDSNAFVTAVGGELFPEQEVIVDSTGYIMDGVRVRR